MKIFGPNNKKEWTLLINKSKKHEAIFVRILSKEIIKPLLDNFISGEGWNSLFLKNSATMTNKPYICNLCNKGLC